MLKCASCEKCLVMKLFLQVGSFARFKHHIIKHKFQQEAAVIMISFINLTCLTTNAARYVSKMTMQAMQHDVTQQHLESNTMPKSIWRSLRSMFAPLFLFLRLYTDNFVHASSYLLVLIRRDVQS
jgi:hypothetical protein